MLIRMGSVSNSSTRSFILYGIKLTDDNKYSIWLTIKNKLPRNIIAEVMEYLSISNESDIDIDEFLYEIYNLFGKSVVPFIVINDDDDIYIGYGNEYDNNGDVYELDINSANKTMEFLEITDPKLYYGSVLPRK